MFFTSHSAIPLHSRLLNDSYRSRVRISHPWLHLIFSADRMFCTSTRDIDRTRQIPLFYDRFSFQRTTITVWSRVISKGLDDQLTINLTFLSIIPQDNQQNNIQQKIPSMHIHQYMSIMSQHNRYPLNQLTWPVFFHRKTMFKKYTNSQGK